MWPPPPRPAPLLLGPGHFAAESAPESHLKMSLPLACHPPRQALKLKGKEGCQGCNQALPALNAGTTPVPFPLIDLSPFRCDGDMCVRVCV